MPQLAKRHYAYFWGALAAGFAGLAALTNATITLHTHKVEELFIVAGSLFVPILFVYYLDMRSLFVPPRFRTLLATFVLGAVIAAPLAVLSSKAFSRRDRFARAIIRDGLDRGGMQRAGFVLAHV